MSAAPTILIVDDAPANVTIVEDILGTEGFRTLAAADGHHAYASARAEQPDLILLDVLMPGESGFETCARLKSDPATTDIPIIFLSSLDDVKNRVNGLKIGGVDFISKPVHGEEVLARVRVHLRIRDTNRRLVGENSARLEQLRNAQQSILVRPEHLPEAAFSVCYRPLDGVGGDLYDVLETAPAVFGYFVADISGHGASASFLTAAVKALLRQYAGPMYTPEDTMRGIDSVMRQLLAEEQYLTACYARLNRSTRRLSVVSAGHPPLILAAESGEIHTIAMESEPLGIFSSTVLQRKDLYLAPGERLHLYSDGLIESATNGNRSEGLKLLSSMCARHRHEPLSSAADRIAGELYPQGTPVTDDLLLLVVEACT